jgi:hypothetical protein
MKRVILSAILLSFLEFGCIINDEAEYGVLKDGKMTVKTDSQGTLSVQISSTDKYLITDLTLIGNLDGTDIKYIREMAGGGDAPSIRTNGKLTNLDITKARIVNGGQSYYNDYNSCCTTSDNSISDFMFAGLENLASVKLPQSTTSIGNLAFSNCPKLTSVIIPDSVTSIGSAAFTGTGLTSITIPDKVKSINYWTFYNCLKLSTVNLPKEITSIGLNVFANCENLESINLPDSVTSISYQAFMNCKKLKFLTLPDSIASIESRAFYGCTGLKEIHCCSNTAPTIYENTFDQIDKTICKLYVPKGHSKDYSNAIGWKSFTNIIEK